MLEYFNIEPALFKCRGPTVSIVEKAEERWIAPRLALRPTDQVLDFACGLGRWTLQIHGKVSQVVAIDVAPRLISAIRRLRLRRIVPIRGSDEQLRKFEGQFDKIIFAQGLEFFRKEGPLLKKFRWALKPGGRLFLSTWTPALIEGASGVRVDKDRVYVRKVQDTKQIGCFAGFARSHRSAKHSSRPGLGESWLKQSKSGRSAFRGPSSGFLAESL